jgi:hypothetical protein
MAWTQARQLAANGRRNITRFRKYEFHYFQCMRVLLDRFYDAVEGKGPDPIPPEQILRVCRVIDQIVEGVDACMAQQNGNGTAKEVAA